MRHSVVSTFRQSLVRAICEDFDGQPTAAQVESVLDTFFDVLAYDLNADERDAVCSQVQDHFNQLIAQGESHAATAP
jgi:hypothetical protein